MTGITTGSITTLSAGGDERLAIVAVSFSGRLSPDLDGLEPGYLVVAPPNGVQTLPGRAAGPWIDYSGQPEPLPAMLAQAHEWLEAGEIQIAILAGPVTLGIMRLGDTRRYCQKVWAVLSALAFQVRTTPATLPGAIAACARAALRTAGLEPEDIGCLAALERGEETLERAELNGLAAVYTGRPLQTALSSHPVGSEGLAGLVALAHLAAAIAGRVRPAWTGKDWFSQTGPERQPTPDNPAPLAPARPGESQPSSIPFAPLRLSASLESSCFYTLPEPLPWFRPPQGRRAAVSLLGSDGSCGHLLLDEAPTGCAVETIARPPEWALLPVGGSNLGEVSAGLEALQSALAGGAVLPDLARAADARWRASAPPETAVILARTPAEAIRECDFARRGLLPAAEKGAEWQTPLGSYYTPRPLGGAENGLAFVYPGAFNSYLGAGKDLFALFPGLEERFWDGVAENVGAVLCETQLYPRSLGPLSRAEIEAREAALLADSFAMMSSGLTLSVALTMIFRDILGLRPACALGYSLGENSMLFAMGVWGQGNALDRRLRASPLFQTRLAGPKYAVREHWRLPVQVDAENDKADLWHNYLLMAPSERVREILVSEERVYLTHINTPRQVVIAGDPAACRRVIERLKCSALRAPFNDVLHCPAMASEYPALYDLHTWPLRQPSPLPLYSAAEQCPFEMTVPAIARGVARGLCSMLDFPRLVENAYAGGARIFLELGAGSNCAKWIEDILRGRPFLSVSANRKGLDDASAILRVVARLMSHRVPIKK